MQSFVMMNTPSIWEAMRDEEAHARVARLRRSAAGFRNVYAAFAPWQHLATGIAELDALLSAAGVGSTSGAAAAVRADATTDCSDEGEEKQGQSGRGGLAVGSLHEFYGPPLSGRSFVLRRLAMTFAQSMTACRQWCFDELERDEMWLASPTLEGGELEKLWAGDSSGEFSCSPTEQEQQHSGPRQASSAATRAPTVAVYDWDLYVCLVRGTSSQLTTPPPTPSLSADSLAWLRAIMQAIPLPTGNPTFSAGGKCRREGHAQAIAASSQQHLQRSYAADHCHVCEVSSPNELLDFLSQLVAADQAEESAATTRRVTNAQNVLSSSLQPPQSRASTPAGFFDDTRATPKARRSKRPRSHSLSHSHRSDSSANDHRYISMSTAASSPSSSSYISPPKRLWDMQRQRLLLVDGLDQLWLHPSLGTHSGTHTGQWFAAELHRHIRRFLTPQCWTAAAKRSADPHVDAPVYHPLMVFSTVVVTNGCQGGSHGLSTPQQLQDRLRSSVLSLPAVPQGRQNSSHNGSKRGPGFSASASALPRPTGNPVWWAAVDTRCLVEPAHPSLVSFPATTASSAEATASAIGEAAASPFATTRWLREGADGSSSLAQARKTRDPPVETHVTMVQGGSHVCAAWLERCDGDDEE